MGCEQLDPAVAPLVRQIADYAVRYRDRTTARDALACADELRDRFDIAVPDEGRPAEQVLGDLIAAAEPGLIGSTAEGFLSWVIGGSHPAGVAADWLTSIWGQNAAIYQTSPSAAICEEACARGLLDLLDLPSESEVGFVTGATMATFACLAAARGETLRRAGHDFERHGLQGAPHVNILIGEDAHAANWSALRYLGFGKANFVIVQADDNGLMRAEALRRAAEKIAGPAIIVAQAGHINSGGFDDFRAVADVAAKLDAWVHVDGALGCGRGRHPPSGHSPMALTWRIPGRSTGTNGCKLPTTAASRSSATKPRLGKRCRRRPDI